MFCFKIKGRDGQQSAPTKEVFMSLEWLFEQFRTHMPRELWFALAAAYQAIEQDRLMIASLRQEVSELLDENEQLRAGKIANKR